MGMSRDVRAVLDHRTRPEQIMQNSANVQYPPLGMFGSALDLTNNIYSGAKARKVHDSRQTVLAYMKS